MCRQRLRWESGTGVLYLDGDPVLTLKKPAKNQRTILDRFQAMRWMYSVTVPSTRTTGHRRVPWVEDAVKALNRKQNRIRFTGDGTGDGVCYQIESDTQTD